jgi:TRAP-type mannitol/chloroaromatic compound transport system permease small subunit
MLIMPIILGLQGVAEILKSLLTLTGNPTITGSVKSTNNHTRQ